MRTLIAVSALALLAFASGCASSRASAPTTTSAATIDTSNYNPPSDGYVFVEQPKVEAAPKSEPAPMHLAAPNHEAPSGHIHAATN